MSNRTTKVYLVAAGDYHDIDFARLELLKLLGENDKIRVSVAQNYRDVDAIRAADFLITYTCNVVPNDAEQQALRDFVASGKRWFALHGTNSILKFLADGRVDSPEIAPVLLPTLRTPVIPHPPIAPFRVRVADPQHELVKGIEEFDADDELYLSRVHGKLHMLLDTRYTGAARGFVEEQWNDDAPRPVYYLHKVGDGEVLYLNLGHCRGYYDMQPMMDRYPRIERGSWQLPQFYELLRRGIAYCAARAG